MVLKRSVRLFLGSVAVYMAVTLLHGCGAGPSSASSGASSSMGGHGGTGAATGGGSGGHGGSILNPIADAVAKSGSRLKAQWMAGDDDSRWYPAIWDSERKENCTFRVASDGKTRCLPLGESASVSMYFSDVGCLKAVASYPAGVGCPTPQSIIRSEAGSGLCGGSKTSVYVLGAQVDQSKLHVLSGGSCVDAGAVPAEYAYYVVGAEVPSASFVEGHYEIDP